MNRLQRRKEYKEGRKERETISKELKSGIVRVIISAEIAEKYGIKDGNVFTADKYPNNKFKAEVKNG